MYVNTSVMDLSIVNLQRLNNNSIRMHLERLSSGLRINKGADDPSGLAISRGMRAQIRGLNVATQNLQDGISLLQTQDGALAETHDMLMRMRDLTIRGANEATLTQQDRNRMEIELRSLSLEITRKAEATTFNSKQVLIGDDVPGSYKIVFLSNRDGGNHDVFIMNADGSEPVNLTNNPAAADTNPVLSPDGSKILFISDRDGSSDVFVMDADGSNPVNLTNNPAYDHEAMWSPDGSKIVFDSDRDGDREIYTMNSDGTNLTQLTNNAVMDRWPCWSPDGTKIVFQTNAFGTTEIATIDYDGTNFTRLTNVAVTDYTPSYSPDGTQIAWGQDDMLHIMNSDGTNNFDTGETAIYARWMPDGDFITYQRGNEIRLYDIKNQTEINLTNNLAADNGATPGSSGPDDQVLQIGPDAVQSHRLTIAFRDMRAEAIGVGGVSVLRQKAAQCGIELVGHAIEVVSNYRSEIGQEQRRLNEIAGDLAAAHINISASNSRIEDADMARELTEQTSALIKDQSTTAMAAHSNNLLQGARQLIGVVENAERIM